MCGEYRQGKSMQIMSYRPCIIIPCYRHGRQIEQVLKALLVYQIPIFVVDDGSPKSTVQILEQLSERYPQVTFCYLSQNGGKGAAFLHGIGMAHQYGFSHAIQIDADGQHDIQKLATLCELSRCYPDDLISARPMYDQSVPKIRLISRYITHVCVWIETLSLSIKDSMCGFRVYPIAPTIKLIQTTSVGKRMDFDTDIMVRLYWNGTRVRFVPVSVIYPEDGLSNFDVLKDNVRISWMHTKLFFGMFLRWPKLLLRK